MSSKDTPTTAVAVGALTMLEKAKIEQAKRREVRTLMPLCKAHCNVGFPVPGGYADSRSMDTMVGLFCLERVYRTGGPVLRRSRRCYGFSRFKTPLPKSATIE